MTTAYQDIRRRIDAAAQRAGHTVLLLAVSKTKPAAAVRALAAQGQRAYGENYVQEALGKQRELADPGLEWHLIGPLQSNKCRDVAAHFDWLQTLDREKLVAPLDRYRAADAPPLNVLIQVNIDGEASKSGCAPETVPLLAQRVAAATHLRLRGLMAIPEPKRKKAMSQIRSEGPSSLIRQSMTANRKPEDSIKNGPAKTGFGLKR